MTDEGPQLFNATVDQILEDHLKAARAIVRSEALLRELEDELEYDCERLRSFLLAAQASRVLMTSVSLDLVLIRSTSFQIIDEISTRSRDIIIGVGERLSCRIVVAVLKDRVSVMLCTSETGPSLTMALFGPRRASMQNSSRSRTSSRPREERKRHKALMVSDN